MRHIVCSPASLQWVSPATMDLSYQRPIRSRYVDPYELIWLSAANRLGLHIRRDPNVFAATDGTGLLSLAPRKDLDPDDTLSQQVLHELCHWMVNGEETFSERDWGYELDVEMQDPREKACLRLQAWLTEPHGLREMMANTGLYRPYFDLLEDPAVAMDDSDAERDVLRLFEAGRALVSREPYWSVIQESLAATAALKQVVAPFLDTFRSEFEGDKLPCLWGR